MNQINIIVGADICPTPLNYDLFKKGDREALIGRELSSLFDSVDYMMFNLESPLTDTLSPIVKCGPCLSAPIETINGIRAINPFFFTLANNHILDQNELGIINTVEVFRENGIEFAGVGANIEEACKPFISNVRGYKIGIYCCAEHEFSIADENTPGANPYDPLYSFDHVKELKDKSDYVIVLYHGGKEHYRYPTPNLQRVFRKFAEVGADLIIAQHTHCIGCMEKYNGSTLVYGQGNFLFDSLDNEFWNTGLLVCLTIDESNNIDYIPVIKKGNAVRKANDEESNEILKEFYERSTEIKDEGAVYELFKRNVSRFENDYYKRVAGPFGRFLPIRAINKLTKGSFISAIYDSKYLADIENVIECESHREFFSESLRLKGQRE